MIAFVHCLGHTPDFHILSHIECSMSTVVVSLFSNSAGMLSIPAAFPFVRWLIASVTSLRVMFGVPSVLKVGAHCFRVLGSYSCIKCLGDILDDKSSWLTLFQLLQSTLTQLGKPHTANISVNRFQANLVIDQAGAICHATKVWESVDNTAAIVFRCTVYGKCCRVHLLC